MTTNIFRYFFLLAVLSFIVSASSFSQQSYDVVYLKSGGKVIGTIVEKHESQFVVLQMESGENMTIKWEDIKGFDVLVVKKKIDSTLSLEKPLEAPQNAVYFELLGPGLLYSINYERMVSDNISLRIGYSSWQVTTPFLITSSVSFTGIPVMVNFLSGDGNSKLELGAGIEFIQFGATTSFLGFDSKTSTGSGSAGVFALGYRYQPKGGGIHFRIGIDPLIGANGARITGSLSLGLCF
jgi:hypothetical protein